MTDRERFVTKRVIRLLSETDPELIKQMLIYRVATARIMLEELLISDQKHIENNRYDSHH